MIEEEIERVFKYKASVIVLEPWDLALSPLSLSLVPLGCVEGDTIYIIQHTPFPIIYYSNYKYKMYLPKNIIITASSLESLKVKKDLI